MAVTLALERLSFRYDNARDPAISALSFTVAAGEMVGLLGPSGCGKTTALKLIAGLLEPAAGSVRMDGRPLEGVPPERRGIAMLFQKSLLFEHLNVAANVGFGLRMRRLPRPDIAARVREALEQVRMAGFAGRRPRELSGGEQQRVALARALVTRPRVLLLDEPLNGLDASLRDELRALLLALQRDGDHTTVFVTHDQEEAVRLGGRIGLIIGGRLRMYDEPAGFYERPATREIAEFFGATNFLTGHAQDGRLETPLGPLTLDARAEPGRCTVVIRPEAVRLGEGENAFAAQVVESRFLGTRVEHRFAAGGQTIVASWPPDVRLAPGATATLRLPPASLWPLREVADDTS